MSGGTGERVGMTSLLRIRLTGMELPSHELEVFHFRGSLPAAITGVIFQELPLSALPDGLSTYPHNFSLLISMLV